MDISVIRKGIIKKLYHTKLVGEGGNDQTGEYYLLAQFGDEQIKVKFTKDEIALVIVHHLRHMQLHPEAINNNIEPIVRKGLLNIMYDKFSELFK